MKYKKYQDSMKAAIGKKKADIVLKNGTIMNVFTDELIKADVAIVDGLIVGVGEYEGEKIVDVTGKFLVPGFIDSHLHIESSMMTPENMASIVAPFGTTTLVADPHEICNVLSSKGVNFMLEHTENLPINVFISLPSCVPATSFENNGGAFTAKDMKKFINNPRVAMLGEVMDYVSVLNCDKEMFKKLDMFSDRTIDGHAPGLTGKDLQGYKFAGINTDHECHDAQDAVDKLRAGMWINIRESSVCKNLESLVTGIIESGVGFSRCMLCTDDRSIADIYAYGHISYNIKKAIRLGVPVIDAYKMATINAANCYSLNKLGAISAGRQADIVVMDNLERVRVHSVYHSGKKISQGITPIEVPAINPGTNVSGTVNINVKKDSFKIKLPDKKVPVIKLVDHQVLTEKVMAKPDRKDGLFSPDERYQKLAVIERHQGTGNIGLAIVEGFSIKDAAIAGTVSHDSHNLVVVGDNDLDMYLACKELKRCGGGFTVVSKGKVLATLELPIAGLMSRMPPNIIQEKFEYMVQLCRKIGVKEEVEPFMHLAFLALPVIPEIRLTDMGLFDVTTFSFLDDLKQ